MTDAPVTPCPACGEPNAPNANRCVGCRRALGPDNVCPACRASAGVFKADGGYVCAACRAPRQRDPGTLVIEGPQMSGESLTQNPTGRRVAAGAMQLVGATSIAAGVLGAALVAAVVAAPLGYVLALLVGGAFVAGGAMALRGAARQGSAAARLEADARELRVIALARSRGGSLRVTEVAEALGVGTEVAERVLTRLADGSRVTLEVEADGRLRYDFREVTPPPSHPMRVESFAEGDTVELPASEQPSPKQRIH